LIFTKENIKQLLGNRESEIWWPGLATGLISQSEHYSKLIDCYSTSTKISKDREQPEMVLPIFSFPVAKLEMLSAEHAQYFVAQGVYQLTLDRFAASETLEKVENAFRLISAFPSLYKVLSGLIRSIHLIHAEPGFDISFTDPALPFTVFVSVPSDANFPDLRLAESLIHEAMHLQLSIIEREILLVQDSDSRFYSPWKKMMRPTSGILHAMYVFAAITQWLSLVKSATPDGQQYANTRIEEIRAEVDLLDCHHCFEALTDNGKLLFNNMLTILKG
jgi:HEXXH motif-containing protein